MSVSFYKDDCIEGPNISNANFSEIFILIGYGHNEQEEILYKGVSGYALIELKNKLENLKSMIESVPDQFNTKTEVIGNLIICGKKFDYYLRKIDEILEFISDSDSIYFA
jgi:hypothetical protein